MRSKQINTENNYTSSSLALRALCGSLSMVYPFNLLSCFCAFVAIIKCPFIHESRCGRSDLQIIDRIGRLLRHPGIRDSSQMEILNFPLSLKLPTLH
jgi:hypothetical protein